MGRFLMILGVAVCVLAGPAHYIITLRLPGWKFENRVSAGLTKAEVLAAVREGYEVYDPAQYDVLGRKLTNHHPRVNLQVADEVIVFELGGDRLGIVLLSEGVVVDRVLVRT